MSTLLPELSYSRFEELVRDALLHLYDATYLQTHPLAQLVDAPPGGAIVTRGKCLLQVLLDAIESLRPADGTSAGSHAWRSYRLLELRYVEAMSVSEVFDQLAISRTQYQRDHARALEAVTSLLWDHWHLGEGAPAPTPEASSRESLALSEAEQVAGQMNPQAVDLVAMINGLVVLLGPIGEESHIAIRVQAEACLAPVYGDRAALEQVFLSLLSAALDVCAGRDVEIGMVRDGQGALVRVVVSSDPSAATATIPRSSPELEVARRLLEALGGRLALAPSSETGGWGARVWLPLARQPILLVLDNHPDFVQLVGRYLAECEWRVVGAQTVRQAQALALELSPDAILLDVMLPEQGGWDLMLALRAKPETRDIPVIVCSVLHEPHVARALGAAGYLTKPITQAALLDALARWAPDRRGKVPSG